MHRMEFARFIEILTQIIGPKTKILERLLTDHKLCFCERLRSLEQQIYFDRRIRVRSLEGRLLDAT